VRLVGIAVTGIAASIAFNATAMAEMGIDGLPEVYYSDPLFSIDRGRDEEGLLNSSWRAGSVAAAPDAHAVEHADTTNQKVAKKLEAKVLEYFPQRSTSLEYFPASGGLSYFPEER